jgi:hypothetical protein
VRSPRGSLTSPAGAKYAVGSRHSWIHMTKLGDMFHIPVTDRLRGCRPRHLRTNSPCRPVLPTTIGAWGGPGRQGDRRRCRSKRRTERVPDTGHGATARVYGADRQPDRGRRDSRLVGTPTACPALCSPRCRSRRGAAAVAGRVPKDPKMSLSVWIVNHTWTGSPAPNRIARDPAA